MCRLLLEEIQYKRFLIYCYNVCTTTYIAINPIYDNLLTTEKFEKTRNNGIRTRSG